MSHSRVPFLDEGLVEAQPVANLANPELDPMETAAILHNLGLHCTLGYTSLLAESSNQSVREALTSNRKVSYYLEKYGRHALFIGPYATKASGELILLGSNPAHSAGLWVPNNKLPQHWQEYSELLQPFQI